MLDAKEVFLLAQDHHLLDEFPIPSTYEKEETLEVLHHLAKFYQSLADKAEDEEALMILRVRAGVLRQAIQVLHRTPDTSTWPK